MNSQKSYSIRGWNPPKRRWISFVKQISSELFDRLQNAFSKRWVAEKMHIFSLERAGSQKVYSLIKESIDETLKSIDMQDVFTREGEVVIRTQIQETIKLLLFKGKDDEQITSEFIIETGSSRVTTFQLTFVNNNGYFGDLIGAVKFENSKTGFSNSRMSSGQFPQIIFKIVADLLKTNIKPKNVRLISVMLEK